MDGTPASTRERLTTAAARLFAAQGYHGTSMGDLAAAVGIHKSSIYGHITGKEDLLAELALSGAEAFHSALDSLPADAAPAERLRLALGAHLGVVQSQLEVATIWLREWRYLNGEARKTFLSERHRYEARIRGLFEEAVEARALRPDVDLRYATLLFLSAANWAYTWLSRESDLEDVSEHLWGLMRSGVEKRRSATSRSQGTPRRS